MIFGHTLVAPAQRTRDQIADRFKWNLYAHLSGLGRVAARLRRRSTRRSRTTPRCRARWQAAPTAARGAAALRTTSASSTTRSGTSRRCSYDEDQRDNQINARRQQVQILFAKGGQASPGSIPSCSRFRSTTVRGVDGRRTATLAVYRFAIEDLYRQQEHVLDDKGEHLLSLSSRFSSAPNDAYAALSTADVKHPDDHAVERRERHAHLRAVPRDPRDQSQSGTIARAPFEALPQAVSRPTSTPTRRSTTACCSATGSTRRRAATRRRSTRRCTATTFRRRSSRT